jgi:hypothetical protein
VNKAEIMTMIEPYSTYVQVMLDRIQSKRESYFKAMSYPSLFLQEIATIGLVIPRQQCASTWLTHEFVTRNSGDIVYTDGNFRGTITTNYRTNLDESFNDLDTVWRMKTIEDIRLNIINNTPPSGDFIFIDGSRQLFKKVRPGKFYSWLANHVDHNFTVICLN